MRATWKRKRNSRTSARPGASLLGALVAVSSAAVHAQQPPLRLSRDLGAARPPEAVAPPASSETRAALRLSPQLRTAGASPALAAPSRTPQTFEELLLEVDLNEQGIDKSLLVLRRGDGMFLLRVEDIAAYQLKVPSVAPVMHDGMAFFPIDALPQARFKFDEVRQRLDITAAPEAFVETQAAAPGAASYPKPILPSPGAFLNYTLDGTYASGSQVSSAFEAGVFGEYGVVTTNALASPAGRLDGQPPVVRLDTTYTRDFPGDHTSLHVGDTIVRAGAWGRAVRFAGVQFGTNFATDPGFIAFPTHAVSGKAVVPSIVDVYVNNALVATREVHPGPFSIGNLPFTTGRGDVRLVVRDIQNRDQAIVVNQAFYSSNTLLKAGLDDFSAEAGKLREDFGISSAHYTDLFGAGTWRHGITDNLTTEARAEVASGQRVAGASATWLNPVIGVVDASAAASNGSAGNGMLGIFGFQRQSSVLSIGGQGSWATPGFRQLGADASSPLPRMQVAGSAGLQLGVLGSVTFSVARQRFRDRGNVDITSVGYSRAIGEIASFTLNAVRSGGADKGYAVSANITVPLGTNMNAGITGDTTRSNGLVRRDSAFSLQRNRGVDDNYSYRMLARSHDIEGTFGYRTNTNNFEVGLARLDSQMAARAEVSGGIGYVGGHTFFSRLISGSFGVVKVADYENVRVLFDNQLAGRTDAHGYLVLSDLRAYDRNSISVRQEDLPLDATIDRMKLDAAPYFRSGVYLEFPVRRVRAGVIYLRLDNGDPLPSGALVRVPGVEEEFPTALNGEVYLSGLAGRVDLVATWKGQSCSIQVEYPVTEDPLPDLGVHLCKGVRP